MSHHQLKLRLLQRLQELGGRLSEIEDSLVKEHSKDWEDAAVEREDEEMLEALGEQGQAEIARIRAALGRLASGDYGFCQSCGAEIPAARLEAVPDALQCVACASGKAA